MWHSPQFFSTTLPPEKRKKDSLLAQIVIRPLSFVGASICSVFDFSANGVSFFSWIVALATIILLCVNNSQCNQVAIYLPLFWNLCDCIDGNLARGIKKQKMGEFVDSMSSYFLTPGLILGASVMSFNNGGVICSKNQELLLFIGGVAACCDTMGRLLFQKFQNVSQNEEANNNNEQKTNKKSFFQILRRIENRTEAEFGISGAELILIIFAYYFHFFDLFLFIYGGFAVLSLLSVFFYTNIICFLRNKKSK